MWFHAGIGDGGCIVHGEDVAGEVCEKEEEVVYVFCGLGEGI